MQNNSSFRLASVSKQFVAMGIILLEEGGKLEYDNNIQKFFPELSYEGVAVQHLLHHTGGLPNYDDKVESMTLHQGCDHLAKKVE